MQNSRGLGLARAQVTDYGRGSVREAGGYISQRTPNASVRRLPVHGRHCGAQLVSADV